MTKKNVNPALAQLISFKMDVVCIHEGDHNAYLRASVSRDACFTSNNGIQWKLQQMSDLKAEIATLVEGEGQEVVDVNLAKKIDIFHRMEDELVELQLRHDADLAVYNKVTGEDWKSTPKSVRAKNAQAVLSAAKAIVG